METSDRAVVVLLDTTPDGELAASSAGLLGAAALIGEPVAVVVSDEETVGERAAQLGAARVFRVPDSGTVSGGAVDALEEVCSEVVPTAVLAAHSVEGRDAAAR